MSPIQTNTQQGVIVRLANSNLAAKEGFLATITTNGGGPGLIDLAAAASRALYVITEGGDGTGKPVSVLPLSPDRNVRAIASTIIAAGTTVGVDAVGGIRAAVSLDAIIGVAEEDIAVGQYGLFRPGYGGAHA